jgi:hypothetical protein
MKGKESYLMDERDLFWDVNLYCSSSSETKSLWDNTIKHLPGKTLFIVGIGFDPRMFKGLKLLFNDEAPSENFYCLGIRSAAEAVGGSSAQRERANICTLEKMFDDRFSSEDALRVANMSTSLAICKLVKKLEKQLLFDEFEQIIVDIGAMPRITFLTLIPCLLNLFVAQSGKLDKKNLMVMALENHEFDSSITEHVIDSEASFLHQYKGKGSSASANLPGVWFPVMGASRKNELKTIQTDIEKALQDGVEVVPILPFPARDPRLSDQVIDTFFHVLFEEFEVNYSNLLYAAEDNPFHLYRRLMKSFVKYAKNYAVLGGGRFYVSPLSGKLMAVGAILAVYEAQRELGDEKNKNLTSLLNNKEKKGKFHFGVPLVEPSQYRVQESEVDFSQADLSLLWLLGDAYKL